MNKGLSWKPWKQSAKDAVRTLYENALRRVGIAAPEVVTIHMHGDATVKATEATMPKIEKIDGIVILTGITGDGEIRIFIPEVDAWLTQNTPFYTQEEREAMKRTGNPETEEQRRKREEQAKAREELAKRFKDRFGSVTQKPDDSE